MKALSFLIATALLATTLTSPSANAKARMDEAERLTCETTDGKMNVSLNLYENTGDKGEPYGSGRYEYIATDLKGKLLPTHSFEGDLRVETTSAGRAFTLLVANEPANKFAEFSTTRKFHGDIELRALNFNNSLIGKFHCVGFN